METAAFADLPLSALPSWAVPLIGLAAAGVTFLVGWAVFHGRKARVAGPRPKRAGGPEPASGTSDPFVFGSTSERRVAARREGNTVEVVITAPDDNGESIQGWVVDRSVGGLGLRTDVSVPVGAVFNVRPRSSSSAVPWTQLQVKSCRQEGTTWEVGCQFVRTPPWSVLLLFG